MFKRANDLKTVSSITAGLGAMVNDLTALESARLAASELAANEITRLHAEITMNDAEAARANLVAERIRNLIGLAG